MTNWQAALLPFLVMAIALGIWYVYHRPKAPAAKHVAPKPKRAAHRRKP